MDSQIFRSSLTIRASLPEGENPLPYFRDRAKPLTDAGLLPEEREGFGVETGFRILPYTMQDHYGRRIKNVTLRTVVMENSHLRAVFLADYGGRLWSLYDKRRDHEMLFSNPVLRTANLAIRNAWFSGGIEWNLGQFGHTCLTCSPMFFARCTDQSGHTFLRMYEYERQHHLYQQVDFHLPGDSGVLFAHVTIHNRRTESAPLYWWTNMALPEQAGMRILSGTPQVIAQKAFSNMGAPVPPAFFHGVLPYLDNSETDFSYPNKIPYSCEYFFQNKAVPFQTWEAAAYEDGNLFWERSTARLRFRKLFCWGTQRGGGHWKDFLSLDGCGDYVELQAGVAPTQAHTATLGPKERFCFTQAFGGADFSVSGESAEAADILSGAWERARSITYAKINAALPEEVLLRMDEEYTACADCPTGELLHSGSGWGALELRRERTAAPVCLRFPASTLGPDQQPWIGVLDGKALPDSPDGIFGSWITDPRWQAILESVSGVPDGRSLGTWLQLGVMRCENGDRSGALEAFEKADSYEKTALASFCRAQIFTQSGKPEEACRSMELAIQRGALTQHPGFSEAVLQAYNRAGRFRQAWQFYIHLPEYLQQEESITLQACRAAFACESWSFLEQQFRREFATVREGDSNLLELWYRRQARLLADQEGVPLSRELVDRVKREQKPPYLLDFRMSPEASTEREKSVIL